MKVKIHLNCKDEEFNDVELIVDAELKSNLLSTTDGILNIPTIMGMKVDCMPDSRKE